MEWNRSEVMVLASAKCTACEGTGERTKSRKPALCGCVLRAIFRACYQRFKECANKDLDMSRVSLEHAVTRDSSSSWGRKNEEYVADFLLIAKRTLTEEEHRLFRYHHLLGADWRLCCRRLGMDKGSFFHAIYRIQQKLGQAYYATEPYALYPIREYFTVTYRDRVVANRVVPIRPERIPLRDLIPLKKTA